MFKSGPDLTEQLKRLEATAARIEQSVEAGRLLADRQREVMSETLARMEAAAAVVASNLADSIDRADASTGSDGSAADAALRSRPD